MDVYEQLKKVHVRIEGSLRSHRFSGLSSTVSEKATEAAVARLRHYGVEAVALPPSQRGGGDDGIWLILKSLWEMRDFLGLIASVLRSLVWTIKRVGNFQIRKRSLRSRPSLVISLGVKTEPGADHEWLSTDMAMDSLVTLKYLANDLRSYLSQEYPLFEFDQHLNISIAGHNYRVDVYQRSDELGSLRDLRIIRQLENMKIERYFTFHLTYSRFGLMALTVSPIRHNNGSWTGSGTFKTYYTYVSTRLITKYPQDVVPENVPAG